MDRGWSEWVLLIRTGWAEWVDCPPPVLEDSGMRTSRIRVPCQQVRTLVESNQLLFNRYLSLPSLTLGIIRIGLGLVGSVWWCRRPGVRVFRWGSTIKLPWVRPVTSQYPSPQLVCPQLWRIASTSYLTRSLVMVLSLTQFCDLCCSLSVHQATI